MARMPAAVAGLRYHHQSALLMPTSATPGRCRALEVPKSPTDGAPIGPCAGPAVPRALDVNNALKRRKWRRCTTVTAPETGSPSTAGRNFNHTRLLAYSRNPSSLQHARSWAGRGKSAAKTQSSPAPICHGCACALDHAQP